MRKKELQFLKMLELFSRGIYQFNLQMLHAVPFPLSLSCNFRMHSEKTEVEDNARSYCYYVYFFPLLPNRLPAVTRPTLPFPKKGNTKTAPPETLIGPKI